MPSRSSKRALLKVRQQPEMSTTPLHFEIPFVPSSVPSVTAKRRRDDEEILPILGLASKKRTVLERRGEASRGEEGGFTAINPSGALFTRKRRLFQCILANDTQEAKRLRAADEEQGGEQLALTRARTIILPEGGMKSMLRASTIAAPINCNPTTLINFTPIEDFWRKCILNAIRANAHETWIVLPESEGGHVFRVSLIRNQQQAIACIDEMIVHAEVQHNEKLDIKMAD
jgi:hypothetical protein